MSAIDWKLSNIPVDYPESVNFMEERIASISAGDAEELVWLLEHPEIYTAGTSSNESELLRPDLPIYKSGRGGKYTYHGPGQRIGYIMLDLKKRAKSEKPDLKECVHNLEELIIQTLAEIDVKAHRKKSHIGIWVGDEKIAAIGIRVRKWVTYHGFSINVNPNLERFSGIVPCGIREFGITSLEKLGFNSSYNVLDNFLKVTFDKIF